MENNELHNSESNENSGIKQIEPFTMRSSSRLRSKTSSVSKDRSLEGRSPIVFGGGSRFNLPADIIKKIGEQDKVLGFVVYSSGNLDQKENYFNALERGWKPLDARQYPELMRQYDLSPFGKTEEDYLVRKGGQIAMVRDKDIDDSEKEYYDSERQRMEYMSSMYKQHDSRMPRPFIDERTRHRNIF